MPGYEKELRHWLLLNYKMQNRQGVAPMGHEFYSFFCYKAVAPSGALISCAILGIEMHATKWLPPTGHLSNARALRLEDTLQSDRT